MKLDLTGADDWPLGCFPAGRLGEDIDDFCKRVAIGRVKMRGRRRLIEMRSGWFEIRIAGGNLRARPVAK